MSTQHKAGLSEEVLSEKAVVDYLREHPNFFEQHAGLLAILKVPHPSGAAVSLIERQVSLLREQNRHLKRKLLDLVQIGRDNEQLAERMHVLGLSLMKSQDLNEMLNALRDTLHSEFHADAVAVQLFDGYDAKAHGTWIQSLRKDDPAFGALDNFFKHHRPLCGRLKPEQIACLFGPQASEIGSAVLLPLGEQGRYGLLAIGSREHDRFHPGMGTLFLKHMGELVSRALRPHLE